MHTIVFEHSIEYVENARASRPRDAAVSNLFRYRLWQTLCSKKISFAYIHRQHRVSICVIFFLHMTPTFSAHSVRSHTAQRFHWNISTIQKCGNILRFVCIDEKSTQTQLIIGFYASRKKHRLWNKITNQNKTFALNLLRLKSKMLDQHEIYLIYVIFVLPLEWESRWWNSLR